MGKLRERRFKAHYSTKSKESDSTPLTNAEYTAPLNTSDNPFAGIPINVDNIIQPNDPNFDAKSVSSHLSRIELKREEQHLPKKEKIKRRHERFMQKLELFKQFKKEKKAKKKRQKTVVVGDMQSLFDSLPEPTEFTLEKKKKKEIKPRPRLSMKAKTRQKEHLKDVKHFQIILNNSAFRKNPTKTITEFLKQKVASERPDLIS